MNSGSELRPYFAGVGLVDDQPERLLARPP